MRLRAWPLWSIWFLLGEFRQMSLNVRRCPNPSTTATLWRWCGHPLRNWNWLPLCLSKRWCTNWRRAMNLSVVRFFQPIETKQFLHCSSLSRVAVLSRLDPWRWFCSSWFHHHRIQSLVIKRVGNVIDVVGRAWWFESQILNQTFVGWVFSCFDVIKHLSV